MVTLIDVHSCTPENQQELADVLAEAVRSGYRHEPGFVSANIRRSFDGTRVANYAQWESREALEAARALAPYRERVERLISSFDGMHEYEVVQSVLGSA